MNTPKAAIAEQKRIRAMDAGQLREHLAQQLAEMPALVSPGRAARFDTKLRRLARMTNQHTDHVLRDLKSDVAAIDGDMNASEALIQRGIEEKHALRGA